MGAESRYAKVTDDLRLMTDARDALARRDINRSTMLDNRKSTITELQKLRDGYKYQLYRSEATMREYRATINAMRKSIARVDAIDPENLNDE